MWGERAWWLITSESGCQMKRTDARTQPWGSPQARSERENCISFTVFCLAGKNRARSQIQKVFLKQVKRLLWLIVLKSHLDPEVRMERVKLWSSQVTENPKQCLSSVFWAISWLWGVPRVLSKLVKKIFLNKFGHEGQIWLFSYKKGKCWSPRTGLQWQWAEEQSSQNTWTVRTLELGLEHRFWETYLLHRLQH